MSGDKEIRSEGEPNEGLDEPAAPAGEENGGPSIIIPGEGNIDAIRKQRDEYLETARRARADYVNLQRRMEQQFADCRRDALAQMALDVLVVLDDLERAIDHVKEQRESAALADGLNLVRDKFLATLDRYEIKRIEALGEPFDHNYHDAVAEQPTGEAEPGTVVAVVRTGYIMGGKLLRPARVVVARATEEED
ncbi:MAG: nucleotide exchange factor GrpE [Planctomycetota bacterium]|jgi:molecular chaperone GrpE